MMAADIGLTDLDPAAFVKLAEAPIEHLVLLQTAGEADHALLHGINPISPAIAVSTPVSVSGASNWGLGLKVNLRTVAVGVGSVPAYSYRKAVGRTRRTLRARAVSLLSDCLRCSWRLGLSTSDCSRACSFCSSAWLRGWSLMEMSRATSPSFVSTISLVEVRLGLVLWSLYRMGWPTWLRSCAARDSVARARWTRVWASAGESAGAGAWLGEPETASTGPVRRKRGKRNWEARGLTRNLFVTIAILSGMGRLSICTDFGC